MPMRKLYGKQKKKQIKIKYLITVYLQNSRFILQNSMRKYFVG